MTARRMLIAGNWKMNTSREEARALAAAVRDGATRSDLDALVCPPFPWLTDVAGILAGSQVGLGAQTCAAERSGAFTGEVSAWMLAGLCSSAIVGHSERRQLFGETDAVVRRKLDAALAAGLMPILCVGEALEIRQADNASDHVRAQVEEALRDRPAEEIARCVIAYEPIWAIGTGVAAAPSDAQEMSAVIRAAVAGLASRDVADGLRILYGGSVTPANAPELLALPDVDGALVGGASLKADQFLAIIAAAPCAD